MSDAAPEPTYLRREAVHRVAHGRVLVHLPDGRVADLVGAAAQAWLVADEPGTAADLLTRIDESAPEPRPAVASASDTDEFLQVLAALVAAEAMTIDRQARPT